MFHPVASPELRVAMAMRWQPSLAGWLPEDSAAATVMYGDAPSRTSLHTGP